MKLVKFSYFHEYYHRLQWLQVKKPSPPWKKYWLIYHEGKHVGELFLGKSGHWFSVVFGKARLRDKNFDNLILHTSSLVLGGNN